VGRKESEKYRATYGNKLLSVIICLPHDSSSSELANEEKGDGKNGGDGGKEGLKPIGIIGLDKWRDEMIHHRSTDMSVFIKEGEQGKGYGSEVCHVLRYFTFFLFYISSEGLERSTSPSQGTRETRQF
jgi:RimJ/RimL family protein N-acetyltransferase